MANEPTLLNVPDAMKKYAALHGAIFSRQLGWHIFGEAPIALEDFIIKAPRTAGSTWTMQCMKCGSQMEIKNGKHGHLFWSCMRFPYCKGSRPIETPDESIQVSQQQESEIHRPSVNETARLDFAQLALHVLKTPQNIEKWLNSPMVSLGGKKPVMMLRDGDDIKKVRDLLLKLYD